MTHGGDDINDGTPQTHAGGKASLGRGRKYKPVTN